MVSPPTVRRQALCAPPPHGQAAAAAHAGAVDHDGAHGHGGGHAIGGGGLTDELHHHHRADSEDLVILVALVQQLLQGLGDQALLAIGAVVCADLQHGGDGLELVLENDHVLVLEAHHSVDLCAAVMELLQNGIRDGAAHAAADDADLLLALGFGGLAQGANEVVQILALLLVAELLGGGAHGLDDDGNGALFTVIVVDGNGNALAVFIHPQDDELAGLCLPGNHRSLDLIQDHGGFQRFFGHDAIHGRSFFPNS